MRVNECTLRNMALNWQADQQGILSYLPPRDTPRNRQFKLIHNLLLFFKPLIENDASDHLQGLGLMIMEQCKVQKVGSSGHQAKMFFIVFNGELDKKHYFTAPTGQECERWVQALSAASYTYIHRNIEKLRLEVKKLGGIDLWENMQSKVVAKIMQRKVTLSQTLNRKDEYQKELGTLKPQRKQKSKGGSTFYIDHSSNSKQQKEQFKNARSEVAKTEVQRSRFFTELDLISNHGTHQISNNDDDVRTVSSRLVELRDKSKRAILPKPEALNSANSSTKQGQIPTLYNSNPVVDILTHHRTPDSSSTSNWMALDSDSVWPKLSTRASDFNRSQTDSMQILMHGQAVSPISYSSGESHLSANNLIASQNKQFDLTTSIATAVTSSIPVQARSQEEILTVFDPLGSLGNQENSRDSTNFSLCSGTLNESKDPSVHHPSNCFKNWEQF